jgi:hypothetical protein
MLDVKGFRIRVREHVVSSLPQSENQGTELCTLRRSAEHVIAADFKFSRYEWFVVPNCFTLRSIAR